MLSRNNKYLKPLKKIRRHALMNYYNSQGWTSDKKYIVLESDDWGSIRTSSKEAYEELVKAGDNIDKDPFTKYDAIASEDDLELLFGVLTKYKDLKGNHPIFTANCAVANPDFDKIKESNFESYYYEPFIKTFKRYKGHENCFQLWKAGIASGIFYPQLHCREHVNITKWMEDLRSNDQYLHLAFQHGMIAGGNSFTEENPFGYMDSLNYSGTNKDALLDEVLSDATNLFYNIFGYHSKSFTPPCHVWPNTLEAVFKTYNIEYIQGSHYQLMPTLSGYEKFDKNKHISGELSKSNQIHLIRNCDFEPSLGNANEAIDSCLDQINNSFKWKKPASISTHRLNYVGYIDESNRDSNLRLLDNLLQEVLKNWTDVEFITAVELGEMMRNDCRQSSKYHNSE